MIHSKYIHGLRLSAREKSVEDNDLVQIGLAPNPQFHHSLLLSIQPRRKKLEKMNVSFLAFVFGLVSDSLLITLLNELFLAHSCNVLHLLVCESGVSDFSTQPNPWIRCWEFGSVVVAKIQSGGLRDFLLPMGALSTLTYLHGIFKARIIEARKEKKKSDF